MSANESMGIPLVSSCCIMPVNTLLLSIEVLSANVPSMLLYTPSDMSTRYRNEGSTGTPTMCGELIPGGLLAELCVEREREREREVRQEYVCVCVCVWQ